MNVMMMALPSMTRHMRRFERHREALEAAGDDDDESAVTRGAGVAPPAAALLLSLLAPRPSFSLRTCFPLFLMLVACLSFARAPTPASPAASHSVYTVRPRLGMDWESFHCF
ncbi:hypothetical protein Y032_0018g3481 [Ancylostoma ceylanicum]|uniref:Uncharacterized protein n=1 Tax=Ancylostoma ceylanicum TaxID=53326 RepID=A0A016V3W2_9BILA|nr:hypothetical protein Y032_0018g3481 [Ancylostoma ceylanicum]